MLISPRACLPDEHKHARKQTNRETTPIFRSNTYAYTGLSYPVLANDIARRVAPSGYAGFVPGYVSNGMYGQSWCSMMETLDARKKQPPLTWEDEHRWTTSKLADQLKQEYMARLWAQEQQGDAKRHWNLHQLNRCLDPNVKASTYTGHIPNVNTENLVGASHSKVQIAAQALRHPAPPSLSSPALSLLPSRFLSAVSQIVSTLALNAFVLP